MEIFMAGWKEKIVHFAVTHKKSIFTWVVIAACALMIFKGVMQIPQIKENKLNIVSVRESIEYEKTRQRETDALMTRIGSDEYIEKVAEEKLGLIKSNSKIFIDVSQER